jgi:hypothetical protein
MARPKKNKISLICKNCNIGFEVSPCYINRSFCSKPCAQQFKGKDKSWLEKRDKTCLEKYGTKTASQNKKVKDKIEKTMVEKYGYKNPFSSKVIRNKAKNTINKRYGVDVASQNKEISKKISNTLKGREIPRKNFSEVKYDKILAYCKIAELKPLFTEKELLDKKIAWEFQNKFKFKCLKCNSITKVMLANGYLPSCNCSSYIGYSLIEEEIVRFLALYLNPEEIYTNRRDLLPNRMEIDIYIPHLKLAIEVNGVYWHSESMGKYRDYHLYKTEKCEEQGIDLLHILDFEWLFKRPIIESIIKNKIKKNENSLYARKGIVKQITDIKIVKEFLNINHIQGYTHSKINLGLYINEELVSLMTLGKNRFKKNSNEIELVRFCNKLNTNVIGSSSKLFKYFERNFNKEKKDIISFSDRRFFGGNVYKILGFDFDSISKPSYLYWKNFEIKNRMSCQKHKLDKLLENFDSNLSEYLNMKANGWRRVWDCGNLKWRKKY